MDEAPRIPSIPKLYLRERVPICLGSTSAVVGGGSSNTITPTRVYLQHVENIHRKFLVDTHQFRSEGENKIQSLVDDGTMTEGTEAYSSTVDSIYRQVVRQENQALGTVAVSLENWTKWMIDLVMKWESTQGSHPVEERHRRADLAALA